MAEICADNERSHWLTAPLEYQILDQPVDTTSRVTLRLVPDGCGGEDPAGAVGVELRVRTA